LLAAFGKMRAKPEIQHHTPFYRETPRAAQAQPAKAPALEAPAENKPAAAKPEAKPELGRADGLSLLKKNTNASPLEILGVDKSATLAQITKAYRKLSVQYHPDKNSAPEASEAFKVLTDAYEKARVLKQA